MIPRSLAEIGRLALQQGMDAGFAEPITALLAAPLLSGFSKELVKEVIAHLHIETVDDLCASAADKYLRRVTSAQLLSELADQVLDWLIEFDEDDAIADAETNSQTSAPALSTTPPPTDREALRAWAAERHVLDRLTDAVPGVSYGVASSVPATVPLTIEQALTMPVPVSKTAPNRRSQYDPVAAQMRDRQNLARQILLRAVASVAAARARAQKRQASAQPLDPALAPFAAVVAQAQARLAQSGIVPQREGDFVPGNIVFSEVPPRLTYDQSSDQYDSVFSGYRPTTVVKIELGGWDVAPLEVYCTCPGAKEGCPHPQAALTTLGDLLHHPKDKAYPPLRRFLTTPAWRRLLGRLDDVLDSPAPTVHDRDERLIWRLGRDRPGMTTLDACLQKRNLQGRWSRGTRTPLHLLFGRADLTCTPADRRVAEILAGGEPHRAPLDRMSSTRIFRAIEALQGAPNVYLADRTDAPVVVRTVIPRLRLDRSQDGYTFRIALGERLLDAAQALAATMIGRYLIDLDLEANECWLGLVDSRLALVLGALAIEPVNLPQEALGEVMARLATIERSVGVDLPAELRGEAVPADHRLICRLTPIGDSGLRAELRVRPLPGAPDCVPGEGATTVTKDTAAGRIHTERVLEREVELARGLLGAVGFAEHPSLAQPLDVVDPERALHLFAGLHDRQDVIVEWPADAWKVVSASRPELRLRINVRRDWFNLEGGVQIDGEQISIADLLAAVRRGQRYVMLGPRRFALIHEELRRRLDELKDVVFENRGGVELGAPAVSAVVDLVEQPEQLQTIASFDRARSALVRAAHLTPEVPAGLRATLRPYQQEGFRWLVRLAEAGAGGCLADDMGLGKTVQVLAALLTRAQTGPALVVAPTSVVPNWISEAERFAPGLRPKLFRGSDRARILRGLGPGDLVVTSYALAVIDAEALGAVRFAALVLDEAQALKNAATRRSRAIRGLQADWRIALSGTPIENHLGEMWSLFRVISPALFGSWEQFRARFAQPIERDNDRERRTALAKLLRPFLLRRTKEAVAPELPAKTEVERFVELSRGERKLYEATRLAALASLKDSHQPGQAGAARIQVLAELTRLRQLACHPQLGAEAETSNQPSAKLSALIEILREVRDAGHRALVFSQFKRFLDLARAALEAEGLRVLALDGSTPAEARQARVAAFQRGEADAFLISLRAGGTGLNLTAADYVIHLDPWWNPAVEDQATDRTHRIGQNRAVTVIRLVARDTVEETVMSLHADKRGLAASVLDGADVAARLGTKELMALLQTTGGGESADLDLETDNDEAVPELTANARG